LPDADKSLTQPNTTKVLPEITLKKLVAPTIWLLAYLYEACFARLSPWFAPVRRGDGVVGGGGDLHFRLVRHSLCIFAPRSTANKLPLTAVKLFSQGRVAAWPLA
jgi:hypothetical protein